MSSQPEGNYRLKAKLATKTWAIDGTPCEIDKKMYFICSGWNRHKGQHQNLYISQMKNAWTLAGPMSCISEPEYERAGNVNEGPEVLRHQNGVYLIYSANASWSDDYYLGEHDFVGDDPLKKDAWHKRGQPVFKQSETVHGPGHASLISSTGV